VWTDLLWLLIPVVVGTVVVRLLAELMVPRDKLGTKPRTLVAPQGKPIADEPDEPPQGERP
jgi:hypothetical protein